MTPSQMKPKEIRPPTKSTMKKYGMDVELWYTFLDLQDWKCPICNRDFSSELRPVIDHEHVKDFKKMKAENKRKFIRGLCCNYCNRRRIPTRSKGITATEIAYNVYNYLADYDSRRDDDN